MKVLFATVLMTLSSLLAAAPLPDWVSPRELDHPRLGQVLDTGNGEWLQAAELLERLVSEPYVLVGEKHDNPDHHRLQLWLLKQLQARRPQAALALEMLDTGQQAAVDELQKQSLPDASVLQQRLHWAEGWDWALYGPLVRWGLATPDRLLAANLTREDMRALYAEPVPLATVYDQRAREQLAEMMRDAHCNQLPEAQVPAMLAIQQGRDQRMSAVLAAAPTPVLLLAGSFHVRKDLGVPLHWSAEIAPVVLMLVEAGADLPGAGEADYVWVTAATAEQDYCADIR
ncbi:ChaN family lipoprotein [Halopseudomonas pelagia]|uniref:ChaN family lipoprotein n=1 Tax=Halopseudomonas pelagia TaxID=553151 RepID=UPI0030DC3A6D